MPEDLNNQNYIIASIIEIKQQIFITTKVAKVAELQTKTSNQFTIKIASISFLCNQVGLSGVSWCKT